MRIIILIVFFLHYTMSFAENAYSVEGSIYKIEIKDGNKLTIGTGALISPNQILTNCHVVNHTGTFRVINRKSGKAYPTSHYYNLLSLDACVLVGDRFEGKPISLVDRFNQGEAVWTYGYPGNYASMGQGTVTGSITTTNDYWIKTSLFCAPGSSGGPVLNIKGELIGLTFGYSNSDKDHCLAIPTGLFMRQVR